jgi:moderate conductance mechanosensitive channel
LVNAYVLCRAAMSVVRALASSRAPETSLFTLPGETATAIETWTRSIVGVTVFGLALANVALALGLYRPAYTALVKLVVLIAHLLVIFVILRSRRAVASFIRAPDGHHGLFRSCATASPTSGNTLRFSSISLFGRSGRYASRTATV